MKPDFPKAIVGYADFLAADVRPQLDRLTKYRGMRGFADAAAMARKPAIPLCLRARFARDPILQKNVGRLADYGWSFDLQVFTGQM